MTDTTIESITETPDIQRFEKMVSKAKEKKYYILHYSQFVRSESNLRRDVKIHAKDTGLYQQIKTEGGVREICFVLPSEYNIDNKKVLHEGNTRHWILEDLDLNDPGYEGSRDIPFLIIPKDIADKPAELVKFMLSANAIDKRITPQEQWNGVKQLIDIYEGVYPDAKDPRNEAVKQVASELGKSSAWIQAMRRVYESNVDTKILAMLEDGTIPSIDYADKIQAKIKKHGIPIDTFIGEILECAIDDGKTKISSKFIEQACDRLTLDKAELLADLTEEKQKAVERITENDCDQEIGGQSAKLATGILPGGRPDRELAIDNLKFFVEYIKQLSEADFELIPDNALIIASNKVDAIYNKFAKFQATKPSNVEVIEVDEDI